MDENPYQAAQTATVRPRNPILQPAIRGALEGSAVGLLVAGVRIAVFVVRGGTLAALVDEWPQVLAISLVVVFAWAFVFALGRCLSGRVTGSILGAVVGAVVGAFLGTRVKLDYAIHEDATSITIVPLGILIAMVLGFTVGAVLGALVEAKLRRGMRRTDRAHP